MDVIGVDLYNQTITGDVACALTASMDVANHSGPKALILNDQVCVGFDVYNMSETGMVSKTMSSAATDSDHVPVVCFSIGAMNSEGMLSSNPHAGIHQTDVARTIDANGSNPAGYQGGDVVCYSIENHPNDNRVINSSGDGIATAIDASYYKGQGLRQGKEREFVLII